VYGILLIAVAVITMYLLQVLPQGMNREKTATIVFSGPLALESTQAILNTVNLALTEVNHTAGGMKLQLEVLDDGDETGSWIPEKEEENARKAVAIKDVVAYFGPLNSGAAKISMPILNEAGIVQMSPATTWPGLTKIGFQPGEPGVFYPTGTRHFVRMCTTDDLQGPAGAIWAKELGFQSVYILDDGESYGIGIARLFEAESERSGMNITGTMSISANTDFESVAQTIMDSGAELVYFGGITPNGAPEMVQALRSVDSTTTVAFMGPDGISEEDFLIRAGEASEGVDVTTVGVQPSEIHTDAAQTYVRTYKAAYGSEPDAFSALAYDGIHLLIDALRNVGGTNREDILKKVRNTRDYPGISGDFSFDKSGDTTTHLISGSRVERGAFTFVKILSQ
jgi:branched-chain amino acid transport system substrate-binding protein